MKKLSFATCCTVLAITTCLSQQKYHNKNTFKQQNKFYIQGDIGGYIIGHKISSPSHKINKGILSSFLIGRRITDNFRIDFQYLKPSNIKIDDISLSENSTYKQKLKNYNIFFNAYYDFIKHQKFNPYIGLGIGYAKINPKPYTVSSIKGTTKLYAKKSNNFAFNAKLGSIYRLTEKFSIDAHYSYVNTEKSNKFTEFSSDITNKLVVKGALKDTKKSTIDFHTIMIGIRYYL